MQDDRVVRSGGSLADNDASRQCPLLASDPLHLRLENVLELNRSAHHWDEGNRLLSPENGIGSAIEVVE
jgi:hypothetical protein